MAEPSYKFQENLFKLSEEKTDLKKAIAEWQYVTMNTLKKGEHICICGNKSIIYFHLFFNTKTTKMIYTGEVCAKKFGLKIGQGNGMNADFKEFIMQNPAVYTTLNDLTYSEDVRKKFIEYITREVAAMTDLTMAYKRVQDLVNIFKSYNYTFVELEQLCQQIKEKIEQKERERIERERLEQESRERLYAAERVREERRVRNQRRQEENRRRRREKQIQEDYHDINKLSTNVQDAIMSGDQDAITKFFL
jgi:hypothetical protein